MPKHCKEFTGCNEVYKGIIKEAEEFFPAYDLIENVNTNQIDYQIIHASRGCIRRCPFCGTWKIEPKFEPKKSIKSEIKFRKIVFYNNNFLANPYIENILTELIDFKKNKKILWCESQSGFDGMICLEKPYLTKMLKEAGFRYPRIAWDWKFKEYPFIEEQVNLLKKVGYNSKDIYIFVIYNWEIPFKEMEQKRLKCWEWQVQIADCRYRPLEQTFDNYNSQKANQTIKDYHINEKAGWTDTLVKQFRKNVRRQNICVRHEFPFYSKALEHKEITGNIIKIMISTKNKKDKIKYLKENRIDYWFPNEVTYSKEEILLTLFKSN